MLPKTKFRVHNDISSRRSLAYVIIIIMPPLVNPYARPVVVAVAATEKENGVSQAPQQSRMGPQSQKRISLQDVTHLLQSQSHRKKQKGSGQQTLFGDRAFDPLKDCEVCKAKQCGRSVHRSHHARCNNRRGGAKVSTATLDLQKEENRLKLLFATPLTESEKCSGKHITKEAVKKYFAPRAAPPAGTATRTTTTTINMEATSVITENFVSADKICAAVTTTLNDPKFVEFHKDSRAPIAMLAFARTVVEKIVNDNRVDVHCHFDGLTMTVPASKTMNPQYHSIIGQKFLYINWNKMFGLDLMCPNCNRAELVYGRTNFSHNRILFPIFVMDGPPLWCAVGTMACPICRWKTRANSSEILCQLPAYARWAYPVDTKYALERKNSHLGRSATDVMDLLMPTYGNGDLVNRLLYNAIIEHMLRELKITTQPLHVQDKKKKGLLFMLKRMEAMLKLIHRLETPFETRMISLVPIHTLHGVSATMIDTRERSKGLVANCCLHRITHTK